MIKLLHLIFLYEQSQIVSFAKQGGYLVILGLLSQEQDTVTNVVVKYMAKWIQKVEREEECEDSDDPECLFSSSDF